MTNLVGAVTDNTLIHEVDGVVGVRRADFWVAVVNPIEAKTKDRSLRLDERPILLAIHPDYSLTQHAH